MPVSLTDVCTSSKEEWKISLVAWAAQADLRLETACREISQSLAANFMANASNFVCVCVSMGRTDEI